MCWIHQPPFNWMMVHLATFVSSPFAQIDVGNVPSTPLRTWQPNFPQTHRPTMVVMILRMVLPLQVLRLQVLPPVVRLLVPLMKTPLILKTTTPPSLDLASLDPLPMTSHQQPLTTQAHLLIPIRIPMIAPSARIQPCLQNGEPKHTSLPRMLNLSGSVCGDTSRRHYEEPGRRRPIVMEDGDPRSLRRQRRAVGTFPVEDPSHI